MLFGIGCPMHLHTIFKRIFFKLNQIIIQTAQCMVFYLRSQIPQGLKFRYSKHRFVAFLTHKPKSLIVPSGAFKIIGKLLG